MQNQENVTFRREIIRKVINHLNRVIKHVIKWTITRQGGGGLHAQKAYYYGLQSTKSIDRAEKRLSRHTNSERGRAMKNVIRRRGRVMKQIRLLISILCQMTDLMGHNVWLGNDIFIAIEVLNYLSLERMDHDHDESSYCHG